MPVASSSCCIAGIMRSGLLRGEGASARMGLAVRLLCMNDGVPVECSHAPPAAVCVAPTCARHV